MKQGLKNIVKYKYLKKKELKKELKKKILKSLIQNSNISLLYRAYAQFKMEVINKNVKFNRNKHICLLSGHKRGIIKKFNISRHKVKQLNILGGLQNIKLKSW